MGIQATYLGMPLHLDDLDVENLAFFKHVPRQLPLQKCAEVRTAALSADHRLPVVHEPRVGLGAGEARGAVHS